MSESKLELRPAKRTSVRPLIMLYSESGCGKTYSSLLMARGFVGKEGKIAIIDSESGRAELYSDIPEIGGYTVCQLDPPFTPERYIEAIHLVEDAGYSICIIDSASHEWNEICSLAGEIQERTGKAGLHCWNKPKARHNSFIVSLLRSKIPLIISLRGKYKSRQVKNERGESVIIKDEAVSAIADDEMLFESTIAGEILGNHSFRCTKSNHPELRKCFPNGKPITIETGEAVARWCIAPDSKPEPTHYRGKLIDVKEATTKRDGKDAKRWGIEVEDGTVFGTWDGSLAQNSIGIIGSVVDVNYKLEGKNKTALTVTPVV